jgi:hypothetical protein
MPYLYNFSPLPTGVLPNGRTVQPTTPYPAHAGVVLPPPVPVPPSLPVQTYVEPTQLPYPDVPPSSLSLAEIIPAPPYRTPPSNRQQGQGIVDGFLTTEAVAPISTPTAAEGATQ